MGDSLRRNIFRGFNTTVISYGCKNTGKSYTMFGPKMKNHNNCVIDDDDCSVKTSDSYNTSHGSYDEDGIVPRAIYDLFLAKDKQATGGEVMIQMTFIEVYNDTIVDLLTHNKSKGSKNLVIRDNSVGSSAGGVSIRGVTSIKLKSTSHARHILEAATKRRKSSSRSHTICTLHVKINPAVNSTVTSGKLASMTSIDIISAKLTLVDLAGSERVKEDGESITQQKENAAISKDLLVFGQCIQALSGNKDSTTSHVPYRDCKLTRILRDSLGGNCYTIMVACVAPSTRYLEGTLSTLRCAEKCRAVKGHLKKNLIKMNALTPAEAAALRKENKVLKSHVLDMTRKMQTFRRGPQRNRIVMDLEDFQDCSVEESVEAKRWRLKFEKLLKACRETDLGSALPYPTDEVIKLTDDDEDMMISHSIEVKELKEQISRLMSCQFGDAASVTSGLTMDTYDFDEISLEPSAFTGRNTLPSNENKEAITQVEIMNADAIQTTKDLQAKKNEIKVEEMELQEKIEASKGKLIDLQREVELWIEQEEELKDNLVVRQENLLRINVDIKESEGRHDELKKEEKCLMEKVEDARELIESSNATIEEKVAECDRMNSKLICLNNEVQSLCRQKDSILLEVEDCQQQKETYDQINADLVVMKKQIKALCSDRDLLAREVEEFQNMQELLLELNIEKKAMEEVQRLLESATKEVEGLKSKLDKVEQKLQQQTKKAEYEKEKRLATEEQVASLEVRLMVGDMKEKEVTNELDRSTLSLKSSIDELDSQLQIRSKEIEEEKSLRLAAEQKIKSLEIKVTELLKDKAESADELDQVNKSLEASHREANCKLNEQTKETEVEKTLRLVAEARVAKLEIRVQELVEQSKEKENTIEPGEHQANLESRVSELENLIKMQLNQKSDNQNTRRLVLRDQSNEMSKPPLAHPPMAKKRKDTPSRALVSASPKVSSKDDRSVMSTISMSGLLQECQPCKQQDESCGSILFDGSNTTDYAHEIHSSFDSQSFMSGTSFSVGSISMKSEQRAIRMHAQRLLLWAGKAVQGHPDDYSISSEKENAMPFGGFQVIKTPDRCNTMSRRSRSICRDNTYTGATNPNVSHYTQSTAGCTCKDSIFSGNIENCEFFLPRLGLACTCGAEDRRAKKNEDPTTLKSFLRSWQVSYLKSVGIFTAHELIAQFEERGEAIARAMKHWRNSKRLKPARTKSCLVALEIWTKTAKTRVKLHQENTNYAVQRSGKPSVMEIAPLETNDSVSVMSMDEFENDVLFEGEYEI